MKMNKTRLLTVIGALVVALALLVGGTYALFTDEAKITNHLQSGDMQLTLVRNDYQHMMLDGEGFVADVTPDGHDTPKNFSAPTNENMFNLSEAHVFVPGASVSANMTLSNSSVDSATAFNYWFTIEIRGAEEDDDIPTLAKYLVLDITVEGHPEYDVSGVRLGADENVIDAKNGLITCGTKDNPIGVLGVGSSQNFTVKISVDLEAGNEIRQQELQFDLIVHAVQQVTRPK